MIPGRASFAKDVMGLSLVSTLQMASSIFASTAGTGPALALALVSVKNLFGNVQILSNISYSFQITWPVQY